MFFLSEYSKSSKDCINEIKIAIKYDKKIRFEYRLSETENNLPLKKFFDGVQWITDVDLLLERIYDSLNEEEVEEVKPVKKNEVTKDVSKRIDALLMLGHYKEAKELINEQILDNPYDEELWEKLLLSTLEDKDEKTPEAEKIYNTLLKVSSNKEAIKERYSFLEKGKEETNKKEGNDNSLVNAKEEVVDPTKAEEMRFKALLDEANEGVLDSIYELGLCYRQGKGCEKSDDNAFKCFKKAAEKNHAASQNELGYCYEVAKGCPLSYDEAFKWYKKAADNGNYVAQDNLVRCYMFGTGCKEDRKMAVKLDELYAKNGNPYCQISMGQYYQRGTFGKKKDAKEALKWLKMAEDQGFDKAYFSLGEFYSYIQKDEEAFKYYKIAADKVSPPKALLIVGRLYQQGKGCTRNDEEAFNYFKRLGDLGYSSYELAECYEEGKGCQQDYEEAAKWYYKDACQYNPKSQYKLALCYYYGRGCQVDKNEYDKWINEAIKYGCQEAKEWKKSHK